MNRLISKKLSQTHQNFKIQNLGKYQIIKEQTLRFSEAAPILELSCEMGAVAGGALVLK